IKNHPPPAGSTYHDTSASSDSITRVCAMLRSRSFRSEVSIVVSSTLPRFSDISGASNAMDRRDKPPQSKGGVLPDRRVDRKFCSDLRALRRVQLGRRSKVIKTFK